MYDRPFFRSKLGRAALFSVAAMLAMNVVALNDRSQAPAGTIVASQGAPQA